MSRGPLCGLLSEAVLPTFRGVKERRSEEPSGPLREGEGDPVTSDQDRGLLGRTVHHRLGHARVLPAMAQLSVQDGQVPHRLLLRTGTVRGLVRACSRAQCPCSILPRDPHPQSVHWEESAPPHVVSLGTEQYVIQDCPQWSQLTMSPVRSGAVSRPSCWVPGVPGLCLTSPQCMGFVGVDPRDGPSKGGSLGIRA